MKKEFFVDKLRVVITDTRDEMGAAAASDAAEYMRAQIAKLDGISAIFAAYRASTAAFTSLAASASLASIMTSSSARMPLVARTPANCTTWALERPYSFVN